MAKQIKKKAKPQAIPIEVIPEPPLRTGPPYLSYVFTGIYFILSLIGVLHHEMWRDEYQAWMVAADAHSIPELFRNLKYEGNPVLWHAFLFVLTSITEDPFWMQMFHILISTSFIFLIHRYSPLPLLQKVLLTFGYYFFYEYNLISRSYGLGVLLVVIFCILYQQRQKYILWMAVVLFLLSNITIFGVMLAVCFAGIIVWERIFQAKKYKGPSLSYGKLFLFAGIVAVGVMLGYLQITPEPDNSFPQFYRTSWDEFRAQASFSRMIYAYFPIPDFTNFHFWNTNFFVPDDYEYFIWLTPLIFLVWVLAFLRYRIILLLYATGTLILLVFFYYTGNLWSRYAGHLFVLIFACFWLLKYFREKPFKNNRINQLSLLTDKFRVPFFILILAVSAFGGIMAYIKDMKHPFSTSPEAAAYLKENHLDTLDIIGSRDYIASPLAVQLGKKIWYAERNEFGSFIIYDQRRLNLFSFQDVQATINHLDPAGTKKIILVISAIVESTNPNTGLKEPWIEGKISDQLSLKYLASFKAGIVKEEEYFIYSIDRINSQ